MCVCVCICMCVYMYVCVGVCMCMHVCMCVYVHRCMCVCVHVCTCMCMCACVHVCVCVYVCSRMVKCSSTVSTLVVLYLQTACPSSSLCSLQQSASPHTDHVPHHRRGTSYKGPGHMYIATSVGRGRRNRHVDMLQSEPSIT